MDLQSRLAGTPNPGAILRHFKMYKALDRGHVFFARPLDALLTDLGVFQFEFWPDWAKGTFETMDVALYVPGSFDCAEELNLNFNDLSNRCPCW